MASNNTTKTGSDLSRVSIRREKSQFLTAAGHRLSEPLGISRAHRQSRRGTHRPSAGRSQAALSVVMGLTGWFPGWGGGGPVNRAASAWYRPASKAQFSIRWVLRQRSGDSAYWMGVSGSLSEGLWGIDSSRLQTGLIRQTQGDGKQESDKPPCFLADARRPPAELSEVSPSLGEGDWGLEQVL